MALAPIYIDGRDFKTISGEKFKYVGVSAFALFKRWLMRDGPNALVAPILDEWRQVAGAGGYTGPIVLRVFRFAALPNAFALDPWSYDFAEMKKFTNFCAERGFYVDWTCGDAQVVLPNPDGPRGQNQHQNQSVASLVGCPNAFFQTCNESYKNGIDVTKVIPPNWGGRLRSSGYYSEDPNNWNHAAVDLDFIDFHPDRADDMDHQVPKWLGKLFESAVYLMPLGKPIIYGEPIGADEQNIPGKRCNDPQLWAKAGLAIGVVAGITFHSTAGLSSDGMGPITKACAAHFFKGVVGGINS